MRLSFHALVFAATSTTLFAQQPLHAAQVPAPIEITAPQSVPSSGGPVMQELHADQNCNVILEDANGSYPVDSARGVCHVGVAHISHHFEQQPDQSGKPQRVQVTVSEHTYVLQNFADERVAFLVHQPVDDGWTIDSDPKPVTIEDGVAVFRAYADPGETVNLHVGERLVEAAPEQPATAPPAAPLDQDPNLQEVNVDQSCRILVQDRNHSAKKFSHPHFQRDENICQLRQIHRSTDYEEQLENGVLKRTKYTVHEATFMLHNITPDPVAFIVHQPIFADGRIDSTPQPTTIEDGVAVFRVYAKPGQTIKLHVGERR